MAVATVVSAQSYRCDWSVVGIAGGEMASGQYRCYATAGQSVAGFMAGPDFWALVGYWLPEGPVGVQEQRPNQGQLVTRLCAPQPNPMRASAAIRYTLDAERPVSLQVHDLTGRLVRTLVASSMKRGVHSVTWDGRDARQRTLANGIYFLEFTAGDRRQTEKLVLQR
jgi:hypothetical protein